MNDVAVAYFSFNRRATSELLGWYKNCMHGQNCFVWMSELSNEYFFRIWATYSLKLLQVNAISSLTKYNYYIMYWSQLSLDTSGMDIQSFHDLIQ